MRRARPTPVLLASGRVALAALATVTTIAAIGALAGCGASRPTHFYTLASVAGPAIAERSADAPSRVVALGPVSLPSTVDRPQIVTRDGAYDVTVASGASWAGDLNEMVPRVLGEDLAARLPGDRIVAFPRVSNPSYDLRVAVDISRFDVGPEGDADIAAAWQVYGAAGGKAMALGETTARTPAQGKSYQDRVAALSRALADVAAAIARDLAQVESAAQPRAAR